MPACWPKAAPGTPDGSFALRDTREAEAVTRLIGRSFAGTIDHMPELSLDWVIGPHLPRGHPLRVETVTFFMKIGVAQRGDAWTLASRDDDGALCGATLCRRMESGRKGLLEPLVSGWRTFATIAWAMASGKMPAFYTSGEHKELRRTAMGPMDKRTASVFKTMAKVRARDANPSPPPAPFLLHHHPRPLCRSTRPTRRGRTTTPRLSPSTRRTRSGAPTPRATRPRPRTPDLDHPTPATRRARVIVEAPGDQPAPTTT